MKKRQVTFTMHVLPPKDMRYKTCGDWTIRNLKGVNHITITASDVKDRKMNFLIMLHELIEAYLCYEHGVTEEEVDRFDFDNLDSDDPGCLPESPYHEEHMFASEVEAMVSAELGVNWIDYLDAQDAAIKVYDNHNKGTPLFKKK